MNNNFGKLNAIFLKNISNIISNKKSSKMVKEYIDTIKNNKSLLNEFVLFDTLENERLCENNMEFINEAILCMDKFDKKELKLLNEKLETILKKYDINIDNDEHFNNKELYESIDYLIFNKPNIKNIKDRTNAKNKIAEHILKNKQIVESKEIKHIENPDILYKIMISNFNKKYNDELNEQEKILFKNITLNNNQKNIFEQYKLECIQLTENVLKEEIEENIKESLEKVKQTLIEQEYNNKTYISDIVNLIKLKESFTD